MHLLNTRRALRLSVAAPLCAALMLTLASWGEVSGKKPVEFDLAAERMPFPKPEFETKIVLPGVAALPAPTQRTLTLRRAFPPPMDRRMSMPVRGLPWRAALVTASWAIR